MTNIENKKHIITAVATEADVDTVLEGLDDHEGERSAELNRRMKAALGERAFFAASLGGDQPYAVIKGVDDDGNETLRLTPLNDDFGTSVGAGTRERLGLLEPQAALDEIKAKEVAKELENKSFEATQPVMELLSAIDTVARSGSAYDADAHVADFLQNRHKPEELAALPQSVQKAMEYMAVGAFNNGADALLLCDRALQTDESLSDEERTVIRNSAKQAVDSRSVPSMPDQVIDSMMRTAWTPSERVSDSARRRIEALALGLAASTRSMQLGSLVERFRKRLQQDVAAEMTQAA